MTRLANSGRPTNAGRPQTTAPWLKAQQGTWVLKQINVVGDLTTSEVATALSQPNIAGFSVRVAWSQLTTDGITYDFSFLNTCLARAQVFNLPLVPRILGGQACPGSGTGTNQLFNAIGLSAFQANGSGVPPVNQWIPQPFNSDGTPNTVYEGLYSTLAVQLAGWARAQGSQPTGYPNPGSSLVPMIVLPWYSYGSSEVYGDATNGGAVPGGELFAATGFSTSAMNTAYARLVPLGAAVASPTLMVQWALSGQGGGPALSRLDAVVAPLIAAHANAKYLSIGGTNWQGGMTSPTITTGLMFNSPLTQDLTQRLNSFQGINPAVTAMQAQRAGDQDWTACYRLISGYGIQFIEIYTFSWTVGQGVPSATAANIAALAIEVPKFKSPNPNRTMNAGRVAN